MIEPLTEKTWDEVELFWYSENKHGETFHSFHQEEIGKILLKV